MEALKDNNEQNQRLFSQSANIEISRGERHMTIFQPPIAVKDDYQPPVYPKS
jgi:hypothetical protein